MNRDCLLVLLLNELGVALLGLLGSEDVSGRRVVSELLVVTFCLRGLSFDVVALLAVAGSLVEFGRAFGDVCGIAVRLVFGDAQRVDAFVEL